MWLTTYAQHRLENGAILKLLKCENVSDWPDKNVIYSQCTAWKENFTTEFKKDFGADWQTYGDRAFARCGNAGNLKKNPLVIAYAVECGWNEGKKSKLVLDLVQRIMEWVRGTKIG